MIEVIKTLLLFPLFWVVVTLLVSRMVPKAGALGYALSMIGAAAMTATIFDAPSSHSILSAMLAWPILGALVVLFLPRQWSDGIRRYASVWCWAGFVLSLYLLGPVVRDAIGDGSHGALVAGIYDHLLAPFFGEYVDNPALSFSTAGYRFVEDATWI